MTMTITLVIIMALIMTLTICKILVLVMDMMGMNVEGQCRLCFGKCHLCLANVVFAKLAIGWVGVGGGGWVGGWFWLNIRNGFEEPFNTI